MSKELLQQLSDLKKRTDQLTPDQIWVAKNRALLMAKMQADVAVMKSETVQKKSDAKAVFNLSIFIPNGFQYARPALMVFVAIAVLTSGWIATASAKLGDAFYPVKLAAEKTQVALVSVVGDEEAKAKLQLELATRRAEEVKVSVEEKTTTESPERQKKLAEAEKKAMVSLQTNLHNSQETIKTVTEKNPNKGVELLEDAHQQTEDIVTSLKEAASKAKPENTELTSDIARTTKEVREAKLDTIQKVLETNGDDARVKVIAVSAIDAVVKDYSMTSPAATTTVPLPVIIPVASSSPTTTGVAPTTTVGEIQPISTAPVTVTSTPETKALETQVRQPDMSKEELLNALTKAKELNNQTQPTAPVAPVAPVSPTVPASTSTSDVVPL